MSDQEIKKPRSRSVAYCNYRCLLLAALISLREILMPFAMVL